MKTELETILNISKVSKKDFDRLNPCLASWRKLNPFIKGNTASEDDIKKLLLLEVRGRARPYICAWLVGKLTGKYRKRILGAV